MNGQPMNHQRFNQTLIERAGEYVLGTLSGKDLEQFTEQLKTDVQFQQAVAYWEQRLVPLIDITEAIEPQQHVWQRIEDTVQAVEKPASWAVSSSKTQSSAPSLLNRLWNNLWVWRSLALSGLTGALVLASAMFMGVLSPHTPPKYMVVLVAPQEKTPGWVIQASSDQQVQLIPLGAFELPEDKALQFWTKADGWKGPVSLGLVKPGQTIQVPLNQLPPLQNNQLFELTLEPSSGSPIGRPTGPVQFIGRAVKVI